MRVCAVRMVLPGVWRPHFRGALIDIMSPFLLPKGVAKQMRDAEKAVDELTCVTIAPCRSPTAHPQPPPSGPTNSYPSPNLELFDSNIFKPI